VSLPPDDTLGIRAALSFRGRPVHLSTRRTAHEPCPRRRRRIAALLPDTRSRAALETAHLDDPFRHRVRQVRPATSEGWLWTLLLAGRGHRAPAGRPRPQAAQRADAPGRCRVKSARRTATRVVPEGRALAGLTRD